MLRTPLLATATAIAALVLPAAATAQSAGNDQYQDPLATGHHSTHGGSNSGGGGSGTSGTTATAPQTTPTTPTDPSTHTTRASGRQLPRTGFDVILPVEVGLLLTLSGITLQRMLVIQSRRR
jgi:hypothetical protein